MASGEEEFLDCRDDARVKDVEQAYFHIGKHKGLPTD
jgi:hypothetical protein